MSINPSSFTLEQNECPICMDLISGANNRVVTECGHSFHCSCLMQNTAHNGFGCPFCRTKMAEEPEYDDETNDSSETESIIDYDTFDEYVLTSFRMFHQQINGEEVEEEEDEDDEDDEDDDEDEDEDDEHEDDNYNDDNNLPDATYIARKLAERRITFEDLVKNIMYADHHIFGTRYFEYGDRADQIYGQIRAVISRYTPPVVVEEQTHFPQQPEPIESQEETLPTVAETKTRANFRRREFIY